MSRILVVDDNVLLRTILRRVLTDAGHVVVEAEDGQRAVEVLEKETPDLVITDFYMPGMNGDELVRRMRSHAHDRIKKLPIIGLAGTAESEKRLTSAGTD